MWTLTGPQLPGDYVMLDEAQDTNGCLAGLMSDQNAQRVWVGDRRQAIYGWRGAVDAMEHAAGSRLYLSESFRFGPAIAAEANRWLQLLDAPLRLTGGAPHASTLCPLTAPAAVLCRTNAGALIEVMAALKNGRRPALVGGGTEFRRFAEAAQQLQERGHTDHPDLFAFTSWGQVQAYCEQESDGSDLRVLVRLVDTHGPRAVIALVGSLVDEHRADLTISTAHKAKGREWPTVRIAGDFTPPAQRHRVTEDEDGFPNDEPQGPSREEAMLAYVAVTRAQRALDRHGLAWIDDYIDLPAAGIPAI
jgi:superfamily I DNA/RNA helicase